MSNTNPTDVSVNCANEFHAYCRDEFCECPCGHVTTVVDFGEFVFEEPA